MDPVGEVNAGHLPRPRRYWLMLALAMVVFMLIPLGTDVLPPLASFLLFPLLMLVIVLWAAGAQSGAVRKTRVRGTMWVPYIGGAVLLGLLGGWNAVLYAAHGWLWLPPSSAAVAFVVVLAGGCALDRFWARRTDGHSGRDISPKG